VICRIAKDSDISDDEVGQYANRIQSALPHEYSFSEISSKDESSWNKAIGNSWIKEASEIFKHEEPYPANTIPYFYSVSLWGSVSNDMSMVCRAMLRSKAKTAIDITLMPTSFIPDERDWIDVMLKNLREAQSGERLYGENHRVLKTFDPMPTLKTPSENYDNLIKRYDTSRLFLSSIKVFGDGNISEVVDALVSGSTKTKAQNKNYGPGNRELELLKSAYSTLNFYPEIHTDFWLEKDKKKPFKAQRLHRLVDLEEIASFWRIPIPNSNKFPGFELDTGLSGHSQIGASHSKVVLGTYGDDAAKANLPADFAKQQLAKHGLIVGVPGSGKTTAMFNILHQLWDEKNPDERIPFIVMEPAKTEFRALKTIEHFKEDMLIFTLGDERVSPYRFNPFEVLPGISLESHISRLNACFVGAFDLFDPLPLLLDKAIRQTYISKGWYDDSIGGEHGVETPTLSDLCQVAEIVVNESGYSDKLKDDFNASLLQRLNSLRRGSKGRMLDTKHSIPHDTLMNSPIVLELDALNESEKSLMMMFLLSFVYEYCKIKRKSGSPLKHLLVVEEAHNLIGSSGSSSENRADPKQQTINLFIKMLAEMRALGQGILIADQLPTAIAPQAVKQTNVKILMRITAKDDREEIGSTMNLSDAEMKNVVNFKSGDAYVYHEALDRVRMVKMLNYKGEYKVEEPPSDDELHAMMSFYEEAKPDLFMPFAECSSVCKICDRRARSQAETFVERYFTGKGQNTYAAVLNEEKVNSHMSSGKTLMGALRFCSVFYLAVKKEYQRIYEKYETHHKQFPPCAYIHLINTANPATRKCKSTNIKCTCKQNAFENNIQIYKDISGKEK
jgi:DNA helicase HerA-like ATPase